jgi:hypothetical protein
VNRFLTNLLRLRHEEQNAPEIFDQPVERPLFVMGMPRSGTTFLHRLLTADTSNRAPRVWEAIHPYPSRKARHRDRRQSHLTPGCASSQDSHQKASFLLSPFTL